MLPIYLASLRILGGYMHLQRTIITNAVGSGVFIHPGASASLSRCSFSNNKQSGLSIAPGAFCFIQNCAFDGNAVAHVTVRNTCVDSDMQFGSLYLPHAGSGLLQIGSKMQSAWSVGR